MMKRYIWAYVFMGITEVWYGSCQTYYENPSDPIDRNSSLGSVSPAQCRSRLHCAAKCAASPGCKQFNAEKATGTWNCTNTLVSGQTPPSYAIQSTHFSKGAYTPTYQFEVSGAFLKKIDGKYFLIVGQELWGYDSVDFTQAPFSQEVLSDRYFVSTWFLPTVNAAVDRYIYAGGDWHMLYLFKGNKVACYVYEPDGSFASLCQGSNVPQDLTSMFSINSNAADMDAVVIFEHPAGGDTRQWYFKSGTVYESKGSDPISLPDNGNFPVTSLFPNPSSDDPLAPTAVLKEASQDNLVFFQGQKFYVYDLNTKTITARGMVTAPP